MRAIWYSGTTTKIFVRWGWFWYSQGAVAAFLGTGKLSVSREFQIAATAFFMSSCSVWWRCLPVEASVSPCVPDFVSPWCGRYDTQERALPQSGEISFGLCVRTTGSRSAIHAVCLIFPFVRSGRLLVRSTAILERCCCRPFYICGRRFQIFIFWRIQCAGASLYNRYQ